LETVAPVAGAVIDTVGGVVSVVVLLTFTDTAALVALFPEVSVATAVRIWFAFDSVFVFRVYVYGAAVTGEPVLALSILN
jgi:hypothetical protein